VGVEPTRPYGQRILRTLQRLSRSLTKRYEPVFTRLAVVKVSLQLATYQHVRPHLGPILAKRLMTLRWEPVAKPNAIILRFATIPPAIETFYVSSFTWSNLPIHLTQCTGPPSMRERFPASSSARIRLLRPGEAGPYPDAPTRTLSMFHLIER
jgi:hypothetical protein